MLVKVAKLSEKCLLVRLRQRKAPLTRKDAALTTLLQHQVNDQSITVFTTLFKEKGSPIDDIMKASGEVYTYHKAHTLPYQDKGPRLLPTELYFEYTQEMKHRIARVDKLLANHMPDYDELVANDITYRNMGQANPRAHAGEYPTAEQFAAAVGNDITFAPMPDVSHFLFDLREEDRQAFEEAEREAAAVAQADTVNRMLKPIAQLAAKLKEYEGLKGQRFHLSIVENVIEGCKLARKLAVHPTQEMLDEIAILESTAQGYLENVEVIKGSAIKREDARKKLEALANKMAAFA